jgi:hypothetical protein
MAMILSQRNRLGPLSRHRNLAFMLRNYGIVVDWWTVEWNLKIFWTKLTHSKEQTFFKNLTNFSILNKVFVLCGITFYYRMTTALFFVSVHDNWSVPYPSYLRFFGIVSFKYPNLLNASFSFQIFEQGFSIHFYLLNAWVSRSFLLLSDDHPKNICLGNVSRSSSLWNLLQSSESLCFFVKMYSTASLCITLSAYTVPLISCT